MEFMVQAVLGDKKMENSLAGGLIPPGTAVHFFVHSLNKSE